MKFLILGPLEAHTEAGPVALGGIKPRAVLGMLLLHRNEPVRPERLALALWGDEAPATAVKSVYVYVSRLRRALDDPDALVMTPAGYRLRVRPDELDAERFERLVGVGTHAFDTGRVEHAAGVLREALALWRGPPLAELEFEPFAQVEIARLQEQRLAALEARVEADLATNQHVALVSELRQLVAANPVREGFVRQLMLALYRSGRQAEALDAFHGAREHLMRELGLEPGPTLKGLQASILEQAPELDRASGGARLSPTRLPLPALVARLGHRELAGREIELAGLNAAFAEAVDERQQRLVFLAGEPGAGKTSLATSMACAAAAGGAAVLYGRAEPQALVSYQPFVEALRHLALNAPDSVLQSVAPDAAELVRLVPEFARRFAGTPRAPGRPRGKDRYRLFSAVAATLVAVARQAPVVLILDDLQWADGSTLRLLAHIARYSEPAPLMVVGTYRDTDVDHAPDLARVLGDLGRDHLNEHIPVEGLDRAAVATLVDRLPGRPPPELPDVLHRKTRGNPFFVVEMLREIAADVAAVTPGTRDAAQLLRRAGVPRRVSTVIEQRLGGLDDRTNEILSLAAVLGREFAIEALLAVDGGGRDDVVRCIESAVEAGLLAESADASVRFGFAHALVRETVYGRMSALRRAARHQHAGDALQEHFGADADAHAAELARHYLASTGLSAAALGVRYSKLAAEQATASLAHEEAAGHLERALTRVAPGTERCELSLMLGHAHKAAGDAAAARVAFRQAFDAALQLASPEQLAQAALGYSGDLVPISGGQVDDDAVSMLEAALANQPGDSRLRAAVLGHLAIELHWSADAARRDALSREAVAVARRLDDPAALTETLFARRFTIWGPDSLEERLALGAEILALSGARRDRTHGMRKQQWRSIDLVEAGELGAARREIAVASTIADAVRQPRHRWVAASLHAMIAIFEGRLGEAERLAREAFEMGQRALLHDAPHALAAHLAIIRRYQGRHEEMMDASRAYAASRATAPVWACFVAVSCAEMGRPGEAREQLELWSADRCRRIPRDSNWLFAVTCLAEIPAHLGAPGPSRELYDLLAPFADRVASTSYGGVSTGSVEHFLGVLAHALGDHDIAVEHFERSIEKHTNWGARPMLARSGYAYALMLSERARPADLGRARRLLDDADAIAQAVGMTRLTVAIAAASAAAQA